MTQIKKNSTPGFSELFLDLLRVALNGDRNGAELIGSTAARALRASTPELAQQIARLISENAVGSASVRWNSAEPPPSDSDSGAALVRIISPNHAVAPILPAAIADRIEQFVAERQATARLLSEGLLPPRSILLSGEPGTGKTMLATWLATRLNVRLVVLDLASAMSSFLGKTGSNLRRSLDFARQQPCVFLLDEFDAIAKRRDDATEVGELKRIVNVLLKELEDWPVQSVLVAATNHPELLDPAIGRRFDLTLQIPKPNATQRHAILLATAGKFSETLPAGVVTALASATDGASASALVGLTQTAIRKHVVTGTPLMQALIAQTLETGVAPTTDISDFAVTLQEASGMSVREMAAALGKGPSTIQYHLKKQKLTLPTHGKRSAKTAHSGKR